MSSILIENIEIETDLPKEEVLSIIRSGITSKYQVFSEYIMYGDMHYDKINARINPPFGWSDPFKSRVEGIIIERSDKTIIEFRVRHNWVLKIIILPFFIPVFHILVTINFQDIWGFLRSFLISMSILIIMFLMTKLKVLWDSTRLKNWIKNELKTAHNNVSFA